MKNISIKIQIAIFLLFIGGFFILNLIKPNREFSPQENRYLKSPPKFKVSALVDGSFTEDYETYIADQFIWRDRWISLKTVTELVMGKTENNNVFFCSDDTLIERFDTPDMALVRGNAQAVAQLAENAGIPVYLALIPGAVEIWQDKLPANAVNHSQKLLIEDIYSMAGCDTVDIYSSLYNHRDEYIYYRTDHHWTTLGAYYGYTALAKAMGFAPEPLESFEPACVSEEFYGTFYSSSGVRWVQPDRIDIYVPDKDTQVISYEAGKENPGALYDYSALDKKDKYSFFLGGNTPLLKVKAGYSDKDAPKLLILRDSYTDCQLPFLLGHFSEIHLIDLRYYKFSIAEYIEENQIDMVLINYSVSNFSSDTSIFLASR
ncbi:MAG: hypothetical protein GX254_06525 [Clostridiales bacterium]|nr:hypothetical protein [Clostridiales bacterium]